MRDCHLLLGDISRELNVSNAKVSIIVLISGVILEYGWHIEEYMTKTRCASMELRSFKHINILKGEGGGTKW